MILENINSVEAAEEEEQPSLPATYSTLPPTPKILRKISKRKTWRQVVLETKRRENFKEGIWTMLSTRTRTSLEKQKLQRLHPTALSVLPWVLWQLSSGTVETEARRQIEAWVGMKKAEPEWLNSLSLMKFGWAKEEENEREVDLREGVLRIWVPGKKSQLIQHRTQDLIMLWLSSLLWVEIAGWCVREGSQVMVGSDVWVPEHRERANLF